MEGKKETEIPMKNTGELDKLYQPRKYRENMRRGGFNSFVVSYKQSDLWIGVSPLDISETLKKFTLAELKMLWKKIENFICLHPIVQKSLSPIPIPENSPEEIEKMIQAGNQAGIGPMSSVAGFFAEYIGKKIQKQFSPSEIIVENGGDIYLFSKKERIISIYAGDSPLSEKIAIKIPASETPLGICTSSGKIGPSLSSGSADAVMIVCKNTALADAFATAFGNQVKTSEDIDEALRQTEQYPEILAAIIICDDKVGIRGNFEIETL